MFSEIVNKKSQTASAKNFHLGPKGLGGWLLIVGCGLILGIVVQVYGLFSYMSIFSHATAINFSGLLITSEIEFAVQIIIILIEIYLLYLFFKKNKNFPKFYIIFLWALIGWSIVDYLLLASLSSPSPELQQVIKNNAYTSASDMAKTFTSSIIWILYMHKSKRVKATFTL